ncbi:ABC transporter permease [Paenibacillus macquariensis]|uniref:Hydroxymethylpyrimidine transport system permease protein n=1 Tax=Paenibacillus macquariensis TaxID=948756 RepID=A0ABY1JWN5_9BACL|nr:ABC transporter permease [Paenibacillus macquariensis]MEC0089444.1 ABC transporter permease [Paenibacillus macquariensis]OAB33175.1 ABC transporter permease [Paenibacillus macquariensis subsp. macquariensis]SIQ91227.1 putative hydroxymethylpyrimidine transport system permease protein [Paenibacillus macquariensis]
MRRPLFKQWAHDYGWSVLLLLILLVSWEAVVALGWVPSFIIPAPTSIIQALIKDSPLLIGQHLIATLEEVSLGFLLSVIVGVMLAVGMHIFRPLEKTLYPFLIISQTIPLIALSPIFIMWFGYSIWSKVAVVFLTAFFPIVVSTYDGLKKGDGDYTELLLTMGANRWDIFRTIEIPMALPSFFSGLKLSIVYCVVGATIGEWLGGTKGLGYFSRRMASNMHTDAMFASILLLSLLGISLFMMIVIMEKQILKRRGSTK